MNLIYFLKCKKDHNLEEFIVDLNAFLSSHNPIKTLK